MPSGLCLCVSTFRYYCDVLERVVCHVAQTVEFNHSVKLRDNAHIPQQGGSSGALDIAVSEGQIEASACALCDYKASRDLNS